MIVPLDLRHPLGNHNPINHAWSQQDNDSFRKDGYMSIQAMIGSRWASDTTSNAVVLRFIDGSSTDGIINEISGSCLSPLWENQKQVFWIISTLKPDLHRNLAIPSSDDFYYIIPSGVTKASTPERQPKSKDPVNNAFTPSVHAIPGVPRQPLCPGSALFSDAKFDPRNHIITIDQILEFFAELFDNASDPETSILVAFPSLSSASVTVRKEDYLTLHREVHQASWDFGFSFGEYEKLDSMAWRYERRSVYERAELNKRDGFGMGCCCPRFVKVP
jgi:hypothetical protein